MKIKIIIVCSVLISICYSCNLFPPTLHCTWHTLTGSHSINAFFINFSESSYETRFFSGICNSFTGTEITRGVRGGIEVTGDIITFYPEENYINNTWTEITPEIPSSQVTYEIINKELHLYLIDFPAKHFYGENSSYSTWTTTLSFDKGNSTCS